MVFRKATEKDNLEKIAELLYYTDPYIYPYWFENLDKCRIELPPLLIQEKFFFNVNNLYIALQDNIILGLICVVDKKTDLSYNYSELKKVSRRYQFTIDNYIMKLIDEVEAAEFAYISNVCVDPNYRDMHIGTFLLDNLIKEYKEKNYNEIVLDVLADNPRAIHLYQKMGFEKESDIFPGFNGPKKEKPDVFTMKNDIE
jgi:ribosomal protein S18 acetylase RimI-like enzyme